MKLSRIDTEIDKNAKFCQFSSFLLIFRQTFEGINLGLEC